MKLFVYSVGAVLAWPESAYVHKSFNRTYPEKTYSQSSPIMKVVFLFANSYG